SSDAASTLLALSELCETKLPREALGEMAETIGSDVPFFIFQSAAKCKGRGERVTPLKLRERLPILLLKPAFEVSTAWAYSRWQDSLEIPGVSHEAQEFAGQTFVNDLEPSVFGKFVFLAQLKMWLLDQSEVGAALMSGSGSTVFAVMRENADAALVAKRAKATLDPELWTCVCETRCLLGSARVSRARLGVAPKQSFLALPASAGITRPKVKFAITRTRSLPQARDEMHALPRVRGRARDQSPRRWRNCARAYSRFSFEIKLALISAGHTASHS